MQDLAEYRQNESGMSTRRFPESPSLSRRAALGTALSALGAAALARTKPVAGLMGLAQRARNPYSPFRMGIQSYSLRGYDFDKAVEKTKALGLHYWEAFQAHVPLTEDKAALKATLDKLKAAGIELKVWGVQGFSGNEAECRKIFEFAKMAGLECLAADPTPEAIPILDKLTQEYKINIAIHNHGPGARYDKLASYHQAFDGTNVRVGACIDTGHALRSGEDPVDWVAKMGPRVHDIHLKDVKDKTKWVILGQGDLRLKPLIAELKKQKFSGPMILEYEEKPQDPTADIEACLAAFRAALAAQS